jgi:isoquinoline 1-oxidoreductase beta subunit
MDKPDLKAISNWMEPRYFTRRDFLKLSTISGAVLVLGINTGCDNPPGVINLINYDSPKYQGTQLNSFIFIDSSGQVTLVCHRPDVGNGVYQAMPMLLAEELEVDMDDVNVIQASADEALYGGQYIGGSNSVRHSWLPSRQMGAAAREMLITSAAEMWGVKKEECLASRGTVVHRASKRKAHYGELVEAASNLSPLKEPPLKAIKDFKVIGESLQRKDLPSKTNGSAIYGLDLRIDSMLYASIERSPVFHGKVKAFNAKEVLAIPGVRHVVRTEMMVLMKIREGVAVVADNYWAALQGRKALKVEWDNGDAEIWDTDRIITQYKEDTKKKGQNHQRAGDFIKAFKNAALTIEAEYELPMQSHAPIEPLNVVADVRDDSCTVWGPIQLPNWVRKDLAAFLQLPLEKVKVHPTTIGGGFGRKGYTDFPNEAAFLSQKIKAPVKVIWTREDEMTQGPFRPGSINVLKAGFDTSSRFSAFYHKVVTTDYYEEIPMDNHYILDGVITHAYDFPNLSYDSVNSKIPIPCIWMRGVWCATNGFAQESFIDEVAHELGLDPLDFRLEHLRHASRFIAVLEKLSKLTGWRTAKKPNTGKGIAILRLRDSIVGHVAELSHDENNRTVIDKITAVVDCGIVVNPDIVKQQMEGAIVMGLSTSFKNEITIVEGKVEQHNFDSYHLMRYDECPEIEVHIIPSKEEPGGIGEVGMPGAAPAVANALFNLTGKRIRKLPFDLYSV